MSKETIRDWKGSIIGWVETGFFKDTVHDKSGRLLGWYDKSDGYTHDKSGKRIAKGSQPGLLLR